MGKKEFNTFYYLPKKSEAEQTTMEIQALAGHEPFFMEDKLLHDYHSLCISEFSSPNKRQNPEILNELMGSASVFAAVNGIDTFMAAGYFECEKFIKALKHVESDAAKANIPMVRYIYSHQENRAVKVISMTSGNFMNYAVANRLVDPSMTTGDYFVVRMLFLYRWVGILGLTPQQAIQYLPKHCMHTGWGWVVEKALDVPDSKRIQTLKLLERYVPDYPSGKVRLILLLKMGRINRAYQIWHVQTEKQNLDKH